MAKSATKDVIASLKEMTILDLKELVEAIELEFGVSAAAPTAAAAAGMRLPLLGRSRWRTRSAPLTYADGC